MLDVRTFRGPNMDSDHFLVAAKVQMHISASRAMPSSTQRKLDIKKLRSQQTDESFSAQLSDNHAYKCTLQSSATRAIVEDYRQKRRGERRFIICKKMEQERREREEIEIYRSRNDVQTFFKMSSV